MIIKGLNGIEAELLAYTKNPHTDKPIATFRLNFHRYVVEQFLKHRIFSCLSGNSMLYFDLPKGNSKNNGRRLYKISIKDAYRKFMNDNRHPFGISPKDRLLKMKLRSVDEFSGEIYTTNIKQVFFNGVKSTYKITLKNGKTITCTDTHKLYTEDGWRTLLDMGLVRLKGSNVCAINKGYKIWNNGEPCHNNKEWILQCKESGYTNGYIAELCGVSEDKIKKQCKKFGIKGFIGKVLKGNSKKIPWNKGKTYSHKEVSLKKVRSHAKTRIKNKSYLEYDNFNAARARFAAEVRDNLYEQAGYKCQISGKKGNLCLHHIDPVWHNPDRVFDESNLIVLEQSIHRKLHSKKLELEFLEWVNMGNLPNNFDLGETVPNAKTYSRGRGNGLVIRLSEIDSVIYVRKEEVYDLEVSGPFHNYIADGVVVHNCNATSSRAMSVPKMNKWIQENPAEPIFWGSQKKGMQPTESHDQRLESIDAYNHYIDLEMSSKEAAWSDTRNHVMAMALAFWEAGYHQQIPNRITHGFQMANYIVTGTEFENFFNLRLHDAAAQSEINELARCMHEAMEKAQPETPLKVKSGNDEEHWHLPYILEEEKKTLQINDLLILSAARCAVVSYNNHDTDQLLTIESAKKIYNHLMSDTNPHLTPCEHQARLEKPDEADLRSDIQKVIMERATEETQNYCNQKTQQLNFYANLNQWISQRYINERYK